MATPLTARSYDEIPMVQLLLEAFSTTMQIERI